MQAHPAHALLRSLDRVEPEVIANGDRESPDLAYCLRDAFEDLGSIRSEPMSAVTAAGLLVGKQQDHDVATGANTFSTPAPKHGQDHGVHVLHVNSATAPDESLVNLGRERRMGPIGGDRRHDVEMTVQ